MINKTNGIGKCLRQYFCGVRYLFGPGVSSLSLKTHFVKTWFFITPTTDKNKSSAKNIHSFNNIN